MSLHLFETMGPLLSLLSFLRLLPSGDTKQTVPDRRTTDHITSTNLHTQCHATDDKTVTQPEAEAEAEEQTDIYLYLGGEGGKEGRGEGGRGERAEGLR